LVELFNKITMIAELHYKSLLPPHRVEISGTRFNSSYAQIKWVKSVLNNSAVVDSFTCDSIFQTSDFEIEVIRESHYQVPTSIKIYPELKKAEIYF